MFDKDFYSITDQHDLPTLSFSTGNKRKHDWCLMVSYLALIWVQLPEMKRTLLGCISEDIWSRVSPRARVLRGPVNSLKYTKCAIHILWQLPLKWGPLSSIV